MADELADPAARARVLGGIEPGQAGAHHERLRAIFHAETADRRAGGDSEFFENLYWCAFLLYRVGDPADVPMMWAAKFIDFDTSCGFDVQFLLGAGPERTLGHLNANGHEEIARRLAEYPELHDDLTEWETFRRDYFYS